MKKLLMLLMLAFVLIGCKANNEPTTVPNGLEPLVAVTDCDVPTLEGGWTCIWADEFSGNAVDETKWNFEVNGSGGGNNELQYYRSENAAVQDGKLVITAKAESYMNMNYTSARLNTKYKGNFLYDRVIVRAKLPVGRGTWPAIWFMPLMSVYGGWPNSGEIDLMEHVGYDPENVYSTLHTEFNHNPYNPVSLRLKVPDAETAFKDYEMIWSPGSIETFVDGQKVGFGFNYVPGLTPNNAYSEVFPFDQLFFLILNLAIGGNWGGQEGIDQTIFPATFEIDYVRVYRLDYATLDKEVPSTPTDLTLAQLPNTLYWKASEDDYGVEQYAVYVNGAFKKYANLNQVTLTGLNKGETYDIQVQAVDFVGRVSGKSESFSLTYE